jgi:hypothetical protein
MPTDTNFVEATHFLDRAAETIRQIGGGAPVDAVAQVGIGYAVLALLDEVESLKAQLAEKS